jgi:hypothetical protein
MPFLGQQPAEVALTTGDLADDIVTLAKLAGGTDGNLITYDTSGDPAAVAVGTAGHVLTSAGAGAVPTFAAGAKVKQVVSSLSGAVATTTTALPDDDTIPQITEGGEFTTRAITPTASDSTLIIFCNIQLAFGGNGEAGGAALFVDTTAGALAGIGGCFVTTIHEGVHIAFIHSVSAASTSARTYKLRYGSGGGTTVTANGRGGGRKFGGILSSGIVVMEVGA